MFSYIFSGSRCTHFIESSHQKFFRDKGNYENLDFQAIFLEQKPSATENIDLPLINLVLGILVLHIFWKWAGTFHWK